MDIDIHRYSRRHSCTHRTLVNAQAHMSSGQFVKKWNNMATCIFTHTHTHPSPKKTSLHSPSLNMHPGSHDQMLSALPRRGWLGSSTKRECPCSRSCHQLIAGLETEFNAGAPLKGFGAPLKGSEVSCRG